MALRHWSTTASGNAAVAGINWTEGQPPSTVNDSARQEMAQVRQQYAPDQWHWVEVSNTASVASQTSFKVSTDLTSVFHAQRRVRLSGGGTTRYASVVSSSFTAETTVTVSVDAGSLSASHTIAALGPSVAASPSPINFLPLTGGTLTGDLTINKSGGVLRVRSPASGQAGQIMFGSGTVDRWGILKFTDEALYIQRFNGSGAFLNNVVHLQADGTINLNGTTAVNGSLNVNGAVTVSSNLQVNGNAQINGTITTFNTLQISVPTTARVSMNSGSRLWTAGVVSNTTYAIADETGAQQRLVMYAGGETQVVNGNGVLRGPGAFYPSADGNWALSTDGTNMFFTQNANCYSYYTRSTGNWGWVVNGITIGELNFGNSLGFRSRSNAKAWVYANVTTIHDSMNVSSITYNSVGDYVVNFANALPSGNWAVAVGAVHSDAPYLPGWALGGHHSQFACTIQVRRAYQAAGLADTPWHAVWFSGGI